MQQLQIISFLKQYLPPLENNNINQLYLFFKELNNKTDFNSLYILNYLYHFICKSEVNKRKSSAKEFEDFFAVLFNGIITDNKNRKNILVNVPDCFMNVKDKIASNKREKADILFKNYALSIKTLIKSNKEINLGSFEKKVLFDGLGLESFLTERKNISGIGLGSVSQFTKLLQVLQTTNKLNNFYILFKQMVKFIYSDDVLIAIKDEKSLSLHFFTSDEIYNIFSSFAKGLNLTKLVNRYEGNSLRINADVLLKECKNVVTLEFNKLNNSIMQLINEFDIKLHKFYGLYFNTKTHEKIIIKELELLFNEFKKRAINA